MTESQGFHLSNRPFFGDNLTRYTFPGGFDHRGPYFEGPNVAGHNYAGYNRAFNFGNSESFTYGGPSHQSLRQGFGGFQTPAPGNNGGENGQHFLGDFNSFNSGQ